MIKLICLVSLATFALSSGRSVTPSETTDISDLIAVVQVHRHGQRLPVLFYPNDPYSNRTVYWNGLATGALTNGGKQMHYELGQFTRQRYSGFIPERYNSDDFKAQTTDVERTHMSVQSNLAGMFPPRDTDIWKSDLLWQPIPVHHSDEAVISTSPDCAIYTSESTHIVTYAPEYAELNEKYADVYAYITEKSGYNVTSVSGAWMIYDTLLIENQFGYALPEWTASVFPEPLKTLTGYAFESYSYTDLQKRLAAGSWLYTVADHFKNMSEDSSSSQKYQLYSAHDTNIAAILNTLGAFIPHPPAFASTLYFELRNKSGNYVINIWHKNDDVFEPISVRGCEFDCSLDDFKTVLKPWLINTTEWAEECALTSTSLTDVDTIKSTAETQDLFTQILEHFNLRRPAHLQLNH